MRQQVDAELTPTQMAALATINCCGPITPSELAEIENVKRPTATKVATALEEKGLVERAEHPSDGRVSLLSLSAEGAKLMRRLRTRKDTYLAKKLDTLDAEELAALDRAAGILERLLIDEGEKT